MVAALDAVGGWPAILGKILSGQDLTSNEAAAALDEVLEGAATPAQIGALSPGFVPRASPSRR